MSISEQDIEDIKRDLMRNLRKSMIEVASEIVCPKCYHKMHLLLIEKLE